MLRARMLAGFVAVLAVVGAGSCSVPEVEPTPLLPARGAQEIRQVRDSVIVERAVKALVEADSGHFTSSLLIAGGETDFVDASGKWRFSTREGEMRLTNEPNKGRPATYEYRLFGEGFFVRTVKAGEPACWTAIGTPNTPPWTPAGHVALPSQVQALLTAQGRPGRSPVDSARGTVALADSVGVLGPVWTQLVSRAGSDADGVRVAVTFSLAKERFTGWELIGADLLSAFRRAGISLDQAMAEQLRSYTVQVSLSRPGADVAVAVPGDIC